MLLNAILQSVWIIEFTFYNSSTTLIYDSKLSHRSNFIRINGMQFLSTLFFFLINKQSTITIDNFGIYKTEILSHLFDSIVRPSVISSKNTCKNLHFASFLSIHPQPFTLMTMVRSLRTLTYTHTLVKHTKS